MKKMKNTNEKKIVKQQKKGTHPRPSSSSSESGLNRRTSESEIPVVISISTESFFFDIFVDDDSRSGSR
jgi:hypothetical protein